jgi:hypothetical protein
MVECNIPKKVYHLINSIIENEDSSKNYTVIVNGGVILSYASCCNKGKPSNYISRRAHTCDHYFTRHSEIQALHKLRKRLYKKRKINSLLVINFRINNKKEIKNSCCCLSCSTTLFRIGITKIIYSNDDGKFLFSSITDLLNISKYSKGTKLKKSIK